MLQIGRYAMKIKYNRLILDKSLMWDKDLPSIDFSLTLLLCFVCLGFSNYLLGDIHCIF